jgi:hypothetical protein
MMNDNFQSRRLYTSGKFFVHIKINYYFYLVCLTYPTPQILTLVLLKKFRMKVTFIEGQNITSGYFRCNLFTIRFQDSNKW